MGVIDIRTSTAFWDRTDRAEIALNPICKAIGVHKSDSATLCTAFVSLHFFCNCIRKAEWIASSSKYTSQNIWAVILTVFFSMYTTFVFIATPFTEISLKREREIWVSCLYSLMRPRLHGIPTMHFDLYRQATTNVNPWCMPFLKLQKMAIGPILRYDFDIQYFLVVKGRSSSMNSINSFVNSIAPQALLWDGRGRGCGATCCRSTVHLRRFHIQSLTHEHWAHKKRKIDQSDL